MKPDENKEKKKKNAMLIYAASIIAALFFAIFAFMFINEAAIELMNELGKQ